MKKHITYVRQLAGAEEEALRLHGLGYRQVSNRYRIVARVDVPDPSLIATMEKHGHDRAGKWERWAAEDFWRRCHSEDWVEDVDEDVMRCLRGFGRLDNKAHSGVCNARVVVCDHNIGMENEFDVGVEYVELQRKGGMVFVYDKFGRLRECLPDRFRKVG